MNKKVILAVVAVLVLLGAWWWYESRSGTGPDENSAVGPAGEEAAIPAAEQSLGASLYSQVEVGNPAEQMPDANPLGDKSNPIKGAYSNPFGE